MGELIRRLDYVRRSRHAYHLADSQRINREYSTPVRAANSMQDRKRELYVKKTELHTRLFLNRYEYEKKVVEHFLDDLDLKSQNFNEEKFQLLRARSAMSQAPGNQGWVGPVVEIVPREYYRSETRATEVKFREDVTSDQEDSDYSEGKSDSEGISDSVNENMTRSGPTLSLKVKMTSKNSIQFLRRRRISIAYTTDKPLDFDSKSLPARRVRRKSAPPRLTAYIPPDLSPSRPVSRRDSRSSLGSCPEEDEAPVVSGSTSTRSYRVLREAFKKQRKVKPDPSKERFDAIKSDHMRKDEILRENTFTRFEKIFEGHSDNIYL